MFISFTWLEVDVKLAQTAAIALVTLCTACIKPAQTRYFGPDASLRPTVDITEKARMPLRLKITLTEEAQVAAFLVQPGSPTVLLYPADSTGSTKLAPGVHDVATIYGQPAKVDSNGLLRRPAPDTTAARRGGAPGAGYPGGRGGRGGYTEGPRGAPGSFDVQRYVLVFVSKQPLSLDTLQDKVVGVTIPIGETEAFTTVTMLLRGAAKPTGPWAATAVPFGPSS